MQTPNVHPQEADRLALIRRCGVLDTAPEPEFDNLVQLASAIASTPIALVSLVDDVRQWFKAKVGLDALETPRSVAFCAHAILDQERPLVVPDALQDPRFHDNPLVTGGPQVIFYAGIPLRIGPEHLAVGTLCVIDHRPRQIEPETLHQLELLARQAEWLLETRRRQSSIEDRLITATLSEARTHAIVTAMDEGLVVQDRSGAILSCNPAAERILGLTRDQMCGRTSLDPRWRAVREDESPFPGSEHPAMVTLRTGRPLSGVIMGVGLQGDGIRWILINSQPIPGDMADGLPSAVATTFTDITRLRREELIRRKAEAEVAHFFNLSLDLLTVCDFQGRFLRLNPAWTTVLGWSLEELLAQPWSAYIHPDDVAATTVEAETLYRGGTTVRFENRWRSKGGQWRNLQWTAIGVPEQAVLFAVARDVTHERQREADLDSARRAAEAADQAKSVFLATMSHEIRTPMNGVLGMAELLATTRLDDEQRDLLTTLRRSGRSLLTIINDILDWSKIQAGRMDLQVVPTSLRTVLQDSVGSLRAVANDKRLSLTLEEIPAQAAVHADALRLQQILTNLIGNALKFTDRGGVTVRLRTEDDHMAIDVVDTGIGIPAEHLPRLFTRFTQVDHAHARRFSGTGLGLAISKQLTEAMGGTIHVTSTLGIGSTFTVRLRPAVLAPAAPARTSTAQTPAPHGRILRILVVEDNLVNQKVIRVMLGRMGHQVILVSSGIEALAADLRDIDLILMDVQMPELDGLETTRQLRQREIQTGRPRMPIIALTASVLPEEREACLESGMDNVLAKPIDLERLQQMLATLL